MYPVLRSNLGRRIILLVAVSMLLIIVALGVSGSLAIRQSADQVASERRALAQATGAYLEHVLEQNLERLDSVRFAQGVDIEDSDMEPERRALHSIYLGSIFDDGVFITDEQGTVLYAEPFAEGFVGSNLSNLPPIVQSLNSRKPSISNVLTVEPSGKRVIFMVTPLRNIEGRVVGLVGGKIDPTGRTLQDITELVEHGQTSHVSVIDGNGVILASSDRQRILKTEEEVASQGKAEVTGLAPLSLAPWSVAFRQSETEALAPVRAMEQRFIVFGLSALVVALFLSWGMARSLVRPIGQLNAAAQSISQGDLSQPTPELGSDEIGELSRSLDAMRIALKKSLDELQDWNTELEAKVEVRTKQLEDSYREIERKEAARGELLRKILTAQEEERKRIARELHDETTQSLLGLLMKLEAASKTPSEASSIDSDMLMDVKNLAVETLDNVRRIIHDLRPSVLDDLGLLSAIRWYAEARFGSVAIKARVELTGEDRSLAPEIETALFRVVQEAIANIVRHAEAHNAVISVELEDAAVRIEVEDDGKGFDVEAIRRQADKAVGLGLLGMEERIALLGGRFQIESNPGGGTRLVIEVPLD